MTELLERAVEAARGLPPATRDEIARIVLKLAGDDEPRIALTDDERAAIALSKAAAARGEYCRGRKGSGSLGETRPVRVRYTLPALAGLAEILDYLAPRSPQGAARVQSRITSFIELYRGECRAHFCN